MNMRTTQPKNNKYYIRKASGGYNGAVKGSPTIKGADVLCNCVGYANGRFGEIQNLGYIKYQLVCNAENFIEKAKSYGLTISPVPVLGGIMVWQKGKTLSGNDGAGHVAVVEKVISANEIITSESGWASFAFRTITRKNDNGRWGIGSAYKFRGCIVNPAIGKKGAEEIKSVTVDGEWGMNTTLLSQKVMKTTQDGHVSGQRTSCKKYLPNADTSSWEFSINGKGSPLIKAIQKLVGASADGIAGQGTVKAMQKFLKAQGLYTGSLDGVMGAGTVKAWQKYLNKHGKESETPKEDAKPEPKGYSGEFPNVTVKVTETVDRGKDIVAKAKEYAWAYGTASSKYSYKNGSPKSAYKTALKKFMNKTAKVSLSDCGYFVSTCVRASGVSSDFLALKGTKESFPSVPSTMQIVHKGKKIPDGFLKAGDIIRYKKSSGQHTLMFYATGKIAEAGREHQFPAIEKDTKKYNGSNVKISTLQVLRAKPTTKQVTRSYLQKGDTGAEVKKLQQFLTWYGIKLTADGIFGDDTEKAVKQFQTANGLTADGKVGSATLAKMKAVKK